MAGAGRARTVGARRVQGGVALAVVVLTGALAGCGDGSPGGEETAVTSSATSSPSTTPEPTPEETPEESPAPQVPTDITADVLLPDGSFEYANPGTEPASTTSWVLPQDCGEVPLPASATASDGLRYGDGRQESVVGLHQVVVTADAAAATAVADEVAAAFARCAPPTENPGAYAVEDVAVGAQGTGLAWSYYRTGEVRDDDIGTYMVVTRRGNAVALVGTLSGESSVAVARTDVTALAQQAWERLCRYDAEGC